MDSALRTLRVRLPAVAGTYYPSDPAVLRKTVDRLLFEAAPDDDRSPTPKALIVPHAGYVYSGPIAAAAYARLAPAKDRIKRVVLIGPAHRVAFKGLALPGVEALETPLGLLRVDEAAVLAAEGLPRVHSNPRPHAEEHSLEVQLPFIQRALGEVAVVPLVGGDSTAEEIARVLTTLWGGDETVILVSSDLSHYLPWDDARATDRATATQICALDPTIASEQACGAVPIAGLLIEARRRGMQAELLDLRSSGDTAGTRDRVVGYGAFAFHEGESRHDA